MNFAINVVFSNQNMKVKNLDAVFEQVDQDKDWCKYDSFAINGLDDFAKWFSEKHAFVTEGSTRIFTKYPAFISKWDYKEKENNQPFVYGSYKSIHLNAYHNCSFFVVVSNVSIRLVMFVQKEYLKLYKEIPTPNEIIQWQCNGLKTEEKIF